MSQGNVEIVRAAVDAFNRRDVDAFQALTAPDVEVDWSRSRGLEAGVYRGRDELARFIRTFETFESVVVEPEEFIEAGDFVVFANTSRFRGRDGIETLARSGFLYELRAGLVTRICLYPEMGDALDAAGVSD